MLAELLTGKKAIYRVVGDEEARSLAMHFLHSIEEDRLFNILDARVLREGRKEEIEVMAEIAKNCLHQSGNERSFAPIAGNSSRGKPSATGEEDEEEKFIETLAQTLDLHHPMSFKEMHQQVMNTIS